MLMRPVHKKQQLKESKEAELPKQFFFFLHLHDNSCSQVFAEIMKKTIQHIFKALSLAKKVDNNAAKRQHL